MAFDPATLTRNKMGVGSQSNETYLGAGYGFSATLMTLHGPSRMVTKTHRSKHNHIQDAQAKHIRSVQVCTVISNKTLQALFGLKGIPQPRTKSSDPLP